MAACDGCGNDVLQNELRKCANCGGDFCRECRDLVEIVGFGTCTRILCWPCESQVERLH